jgi:hypothetical protein
VSALNGALGTASSLALTGCPVEPVHDLALNVFYNADLDKYSDRSPVIYVHPSPSTATIIGEPVE